MFEDLSNVFQELTPGLYLNVLNGTYCKKDNRGFVVLDEDDRRVVAYQQQQGVSDSFPQLGMK
jgi:hypothetical protein